MDKTIEDSNILVRAGSHPSLQGSEERYTGNVRIDPIFDANESAEFVGVYVSFSPGARTAWHTHPLGQRLIVTAGSGLVQEWDGQIVEIHEGDVYWIRPGIKHWHGASPSTAMTHMAITGMYNNNTGNWLEKVSNEQYCK